MSTKQKPKPPQWILDLQSVNSNSSKLTTGKHKSQHPKPVDPPGYTPPTSSAATPTNKKPKTPQTSPSSSSTQQQTQAVTQTEIQTALYLKKAWEIAVSPFKSLPMNLLMMYMSGNSLQIFSIMMTFMLFMNPIKALSSVNSTFRRFETPETKSTMWLVKLTYIASQLLSLIIGVWKVNSMGLLPNTRSDWLAWERERVCREYAATVYST